MRALSAGPRTHLIEVLFLVHLVLVFALLLAAWMAYRKDWILPAILCPALGILILVRDLQRFRRLRRIRDLAALGSIAEGRVTHRRLVRRRPSERADSLLLGSLLPFRPLLLVCYSFSDETGSTHRGTLSVDRRERAFYPEGRALEVFFFPSEPQVQMCSLALRWYFRLRGAAETDESPPPGFGDQEDLRVDFP
jgi:hypothetical protein